MDGFLDPGLDMADSDAVFDGFLLAYEEDIWNAHLFCPLELGRDLVLAQGLVDWDLGRSEHFEDGQAL